MRRAGFAAAALCLIAADAAAQNQPPPGRFDVGAGIEWLGQFTVGSADATETTPGGGTSPLFTTSTTLKGAVGFQGHFGIRVFDRIEARVIGAVSQPSLSTVISNDIEASGQVTATDSILQYVIGGGALWYLPIPTPPKLAPFVSGSAAYLRQLHQSRTLVDSGQLYRVSGGVKYFLASRPASHLRAYGVEGEAGFAARVKGVAFDAGAHYSPWVAASFFARFGSKQ